MLCSVKERNSSNNLFVVEGIPEKTGRNICKPSDNL